VAAVASDPQAFTPGSGHQLAAHHQQAVLVAPDVALHNHFAAFCIGNAKGLLDVGLAF
jgi:hypothetical protein